MDFKGLTSEICQQMRRKQMSGTYFKSIFQNTWPCAQLLCVKRNAPCQRDLAIDSRTSSVCSEMTGQWSDRSAMSGCKSPLGPMGCLCDLALRIWTSFWRREDSDGMDMWNAPMVQSRQPLTYRLMESVGLGGPRWHGSSWQSDCREWKLSAINPHDRHTWRSGVRSAMRTASQLSGRGPTDVDVAPVPAR